RAMSEDETLQVSRRSREYKAVVITMMGQRFGIVLEMLLQPLVIDKGELQLRLDLRHPNQQVPRHHGDGNQFGLVRREIAFSGDDVQEALVLQLEQMRREFTALAVF